MTARYACLLCGDRGDEVRLGLVRWEQPIDDRTFEAVPRCADRIGCRHRVEDVNGERWPVVDATRATWEATPERTRWWGTHREPVRRDTPSVSVRHTYNPALPPAETAPPVENAEAADDVPAPAVPVQDVSWLEL